MIKICKDLLANGKRLMNDSIFWKANEVEESLVSQAARVILRESLVVFCVNLIVTHSDATVIG
ncbi:hypothetical protein FRX31_030670, partial [Thalictrum thalictroides]